MLEGAKEGGWVEITLISCSTVDASTSTRDDRALNWESPPSTLPPTLVGAPAETFLTLEEVPAVGPLDLGLGLGLLEYGFVLEACSSQASHWDEVRGEQASQGKSREQSLGEQRLHASCGSILDMSTPQSLHFFCPLGATGLGEVEVDISCNDLQK